MTRLLPRLSAAALITLTACFATACAGGSATPETSESPSATPVETEQAVAPEETEAPAAGSEEVTCESIIPASTVSDFESIGWSYEEQPFYVGEAEMTDGIKCVWADFSALAGDHLQIFAWSPITAGEAEAAEKALVAQGWIREEGPEGVYITENPDTTIAVDDQGYGMTYLFGDGWVTHADTKQGLLLIERPAA